MTGDPPTDAPTTEAEFRAAMRRLVAGAAANGVDVENGWGFTDGERTWGVEVYEVVPEDTEE
ncbi:hypothetical protein [Halorarius halobius]|uniref:hypothetical protein n=1 Tax=Halorarius halobius TaxID=2962671 RepID=UPI0020CC2025|nr:hypothetical protein [Halorarius halobius]